MAQQIWKIILHIHCMHVLFNQLRDRPTFLSEKFHLVDRHQFNDGQYFHAVSHSSSTRCKHSTKTLPAARAVATQPLCTPCLPQPWLADVPVTSAHYQAWLCKISTTRKQMASAIAKMYHCMKSKIHHTHSPHNTVTMSTIIKIHKYVSFFFVHIALSNYVNYNHVSSMHKRYLLYHLLQTGSRHYHN